MRQRFFEESRSPRDADASDRFSPPTPPGPDEVGEEAEVPQRSALEEDSILLWHETEFFGSAPRGETDETQQKPVAIQLGVISAVAWLMTIDPVWRALTPRNFSGIPAPQLLIVFFLGPIIWCLVLWAWAKVLPGHVRVLVRTQLSYWKRWLAAAWVLSMLASRIG